MAPVSSLPRGTTFTRLCMAIAAGRGGTEAEDYARMRWGERSSPARLLRAAVDAGSLVPSQSWGEQLADFTVAATEFFQLASAGSIIGRMTGLRKVPLLTRIIGLTNGSTAAWVKASSPMPVSRMSLDSSQLAPLKVACIVIVTNELLNSADPAAEETIRLDLMRAVQEMMDASFVDPSNAGVTDEMPTAVTYNAPSVAATGDRGVDLKNLVGLFEGDLMTAYFIAAPETFASMAGPEFPNLSIRGQGELIGIPSIASNGMPVGTIALVDANAIAIGNGQLVANKTQHGTIEMDSEPTDPPTASTVLVSLWQNNLSALSLIKYVNWALGRNAAALLTGLGGT
jgi:hypothetical protein